METTIIICSRKERYLNKTLEDLQAKTKAEIIVVLEDEDAERLPGVTYIYNPISKGMRTAINQGVAAAKGKYLLKLDAHCMVDEGIDEKLAKVHQPNWIQTPRRKRLDAENWELIETDLPDVDYMFIYKGRGYKANDKNSDQTLKSKLIDDVQIFQGSCWFMEKAYYNHLKLLDDINFGGMGSEALEICLKCRADGGRVVVNKTTWYAHYHKTKANFRRMMNKSMAYLPKFLEQYKEYI